MVVAVSPWLMWQCACMCVIGEPCCSVVLVRCASARERHIARRVAAASLLAFIRLRLVLVMVVRCRG
jgi:hypothetical protein